MGLGRVVVVKRSMMLMHGVWDGGGCGSIYDANAVMFCQPRIEPSQLLRALGPLLEKNGGIRDSDAANRIISLMKDASKMPSKCTYVNICRATESESVLQK
jgi:hypothetical protein